MPIASGANPQSSGIRGETCHLGIIIRKYVNGIASANAGNVIVSLSYLFISHPCLA